MNSKDLRKKFLKFFEEKGHKVIPSASLVPEDLTTLYTSSGMQPMVPFLLGQKHPMGKRIVDSQKSFRAEDIGEVGDNRHTTFFEMLGNWSLGDYWKEEQLTWIFEFLAKEVGLDPSKLYVSVFSGDAKNNLPRDEESPEIWQRLFEKSGTSIDGRIFEYGSEKNWWSRTGPPGEMPAGEPGGPDSEIFYDFGTKHDEKYGKNCHPNCDCGRFLEIGNSVFMEYVKTQKGFEKLEQRNVDFGGGLERIAAASNNNPDIFQTDLFAPITEKIRSLASRQDLKSERIIADHIRAAVFLIADGVVPSNKDRGYVLRRLIRRAITHGRKLGISEPFTTLLYRNVVEAYGDQYPELNHSEKILEELNREEMKFRETFQKGLQRFSEIIETYMNGELTDRTLHSQTVFDLYQSYGFPFETIKELAKEKGLSVDEVAFQRDLEAHQQLSRTASAGMFKGGLVDHEPQTIKHHTAHHLLLAALRQVLGSHVLQRGSNVSSERLRIDFSHPEKLTKEQLEQVEHLVNQKISEGLEVRREDMPKEKAEKLGALAEFGAKYGDIVSVYTIYNKDGSVFSREFCGGPHVERTSMVGVFKILKEEAVSAGVRRIKATVE